MSADSPFSLGARRAEHGIEFDLVSGTNRDAIHAYDLAIDTEEFGLSHIETAPYSSSTRAG